ncbi:MAG TPA: Gfo/Idh/MocA family oxidoreductase [Tepidisphaeraceae bacterium]|nr:Gfo/Idh/MocA family oxidoreductase [Tepidisphaeraceae bacterium]
MEKKIETPSFTRRGFLKTSAAVSAAAMVANLGTNFAHAAGSDVIKVGLVGCGGRGSGAIEQNMEAAKILGIKAEVVACGDVFRGKTKHIQDKFKLSDDQCFDGLDNYKKVIDSGIDLLVTATPPGFRPFHFQYAIEKGKHVFFEKPVAVDPTGIRMVMAAAEMATEKKLGVVAGTQRRHETGYGETIKRIHDGAIGEILHMSVYWCGGGIWWNARKPGMSDVEAQINNWYHYIWLCGDQIVEQHVHNLDVACWVLGSHPISAYGQGGRTVRKEPGQIWDNTAVEYEFPNGARVLSFGRHWPGDGNVSEFAIGTKGTSDPSNWIKPTGGQRQKFENTVNGYLQEHIDLYKSIRDGKPLNEAKQVAESTMMAIMGRMSCYTGKKISWDFAMKSKLDTMPKNLDLKGALSEGEVPLPGKEPLI